MQGKAVDLCRLRYHISGMRFAGVLLLSLCVLFLLSGCAITYGNKEITQPEVVASLKKGQNDKKEVRQTLGQPSDVRQKGDGTEWVYRFREAKNNLVGALPLYGLNIILGGKNGDIHTRKMFFDKNGRYLGDYYIQEEFYTSNLFSLGRSISNGFVDRDSQARTKGEMDSLGVPFDTGKSSENQLLERALE